MPAVEAVEDALEQMDCLIYAAESWSKQYSKDPFTHAELIKTEARMARQLRRHYRDLAAKSSQMVNWAAYQGALRAYDVNVLVNDQVVDNSRSDFVKLMINQVTTATYLGAAAGQVIYKRPLGIISTDSVIQDIALKHVAKLVTQVNDTVKRDIRSAIQQSIASGETVQEAGDRLATIVSNPDRADLIARTETVNSYGMGLDEFGKQSDAVGHEWQDVGADDVCSDNADLGPIPFDENFEAADGSEIRGPTAHPNCRCSKRLIYQNELDDNPDLFG